MAKTRDTIVVPRGTVGKICKAQNVSKTTVYYALNGTSQSDDAKLIRKLAVQIYGGVVVKKPIF